MTDLLDSVLLDASASFDPFADCVDMIVQYDWDIDGDAVPDVSTSESVVLVTAAELSALGVGMGPHVVTLIVSDSLMATGVDG